MTRSWIPIFLAAVLFGAAIARPVAAAEPDVAELRAIYLRAVDDERLIDPGLQLVEELSDESGAGRLESTLIAYRGALTALRAKHGVWPPARLRNLDEGLGLLDRAVLRDPGNVEARYLRVINRYFLPGFLGRKETMAEDFAALAVLLPDASGNYPATLYRTMLEFVLNEGGQIPERDRTRLRAARDQLDG